MESHSSRPRRVLPILVGLLAAFAVAYGLRTALVAPRVITDEQVLFQGQDAWYHARLIENTVHNFPHRLQHDRLAPFPAGQRVDVGPFFDQLAAAVALAIGGGEPTVRQVQLVAAYLPALLGAAIVFPLYWIGRLLHGPGFGLVTAALGAIVPGGFLHRTSLGHADHHAAEALLALTSLALLLHALRRSGSWRSAAAISLAAGLALSAYLQTFTGGALVVAIIVLWVAAQVLRDRVRGVDSGYLCAAFLPGLGVALLGTVVYGSDAAWAALQRATLLSAIAIVPAAVWLSRTVAGRRYGLAALASGIVGFGVLAIVAFRVVTPEAWGIATDSVSSWFRPVDAVVIVETEPLLDPRHPLDLRPLWRQLASLGFLAPLGWCVVARRAAVDGEPRFVGVAIWSAVAMAFALVQLRFLYYTAPMAVLLSAALCRQVIAWTREPAGGSRLASRVTATAMVLLAGVPPLLIALTTAGLYSGPDRAWVGALSWLREATPAPVPASAFDRNFDRPSDPPFRFGREAYSVLSWWDDGYRVLATGRLPVAIPTQQGADAAARFYSKRNPGEAAGILKRLRTRYVIVDQSLPFLPRGTAGEGPSGKFPQILHWAGEKPGRYFQIYLDPEAQGGKPRALYSPAYYRSMLVRLYVYGGQAAVPRETHVVTYSLEPQGGERPPRRRIVELKRFDSFTEARAYVDARPGRREIVGVDPLNTCVPLEGAHRYKAAYASREAAGMTEGRPLPAVRVFEYLGPRRDVRSAPGGGKES